MAQSLEAKQKVTEVKKDTKHSTDMSLLEALIGKSDIDKIYDAWDPMLDSSNHFLNSINVDLTDPLAALYGTTERLKKEDMPCKFFTMDSKWPTCHRMGCTYMHDKRHLKEPFILRPILLSAQLKKKTKAPVGIINMGVVVSVSSPGEFYIVPHSDWTCGCRLTTIGEEVPESNVFQLEGRRSIYDGEYYQTKNTGLLNLEKLLEDLRNFEKAQTIKDPVSSVCTNQLVAVKIKAESGSRREWFRAIALEDVILGEDDHAPLIPLRLVDYGLKISAEMRHVVPLPEILLRYPPLGYRCALNGVSPITHKWSRRASKLFNDLAYTKECVFELTRSSSCSDGIFEDVPHLVELSVMVGESYVNLSERLISEGLGIQWNPFPTRPSVLKDVNDSRAIGLLMARSSCLSSPLDAKLDPETVKLEKARLEKFLSNWHLRNKFLNSTGTGTETDTKNLCFNPIHGTPSVENRIKIPISCHEAVTTKLMTTVRNKWVSQLAAAKTLRSNFKPSPADPVRQYESKVDSWREPIPAWKLESEGPSTSTSSGGISSYDEEHSQSQQLEPPPPNIPKRKQKTKWKPLTKPRAFNL